MQCHHYRHSCFLTPDIVNYTIAATAVTIKWTSIPPHPLLPPESSTFLTHSSIDNTPAVAAVAVAADDSAATATAII